MVGAGTVYRPARPCSMLDSGLVCVGNRPGGLGLVGSDDFQDVDDDIFDIAPHDLSMPSTPAAHDKLQSGLGGAGGEEEEETSWRVRVVIRDFVMRVQETSLSCKGLTLVALEHLARPEILMPSMLRNANPTAALPHAIPPLGLDVGAQPERGEGGQARTRRHIMVHVARVVVQHEDAVCIGYSTLLDPHKHTEYSYSHSHPGASTPQGAAGATSPPWDLRFACFCAAPRPSTCAWLVCDKCIM
jgi:hypothetical protein